MCQLMTLIQTVDMLRTVAQVHLSALRYWRQLLLHHSPPLYLFMVRVVCF